MIESSSSQERLIWIFQVAGYDCGLPLVWAVPTDWLLIVYFGQSRSPTSDPWTRIEISPPLGYVSVHQIFISTYRHSLPIAASDDDVPAEFVLLQLLLRTRKLGECDACDFYCPVWLHRDIYPLLCWGFSPTHFPDRHWKSVSNCFHIHINGGLSVWNLSHS